MDGLVFPKVNDDLLGLVDIQGEVVLAVPYSQVLYFSPVGTLVVITDHSYDRGIVSKIYFCNTVMSE